MFMRCIFSAAAFVGVACGPSIPIEGIPSRTSGDTDTGHTRATSVASSSSTSGSRPDDGPEDGPEDSETSDAGGSFIPLPDGGSMECDVFAQDCPAGEKCAAYGPDSAMGQTCEPYYEAGGAPEGLENLGTCVTLP